MPTYSFPAHVYACAVQDQGFFLDLKRNQYLSVPLCELQSLSRYVAGWPTHLESRNAAGGAAKSESMLTELARNHLVNVNSSRDRESEWTVATPACKSLLEYGTTEFPPVFRPYLLSFSKAALVARYVLSSRPLYSMINRLERRRARRNTAGNYGDLPTMRRLVQIFKRLQPLLPPTGTPCLVTSVTLLEFLAAFEQFPRLVFGVQAYPFNAHCWLQHEDVVLNSALESVRQFTPMSSRRRA